MKKLIFLVSGNGTNMMHIINAIKNNILDNCKIILVISDRNCKALQYAINYGIKFVSLKRDKFLYENIDRLLVKYQPNIIILSGFLSILNNIICKKWSGKIINIHPSILPKYGGKGMYGKKVHELVIKNKDKISGATVHFVTEKIDSGYIILKKIYKLSKNENVDSLSKKISSIEKKILIESLKIL
ncbi:formyltransferase family protein [Blattabacterium cuenoti]|uniref:formyltransferase family protein n=1 Tax=Blattabacterium cuenoti TaxID=1653831 RepID=UPI00163BF40C|nr:formyltransferase family protein [Blattabacterium cuenoti]